MTNFLLSQENFENRLGVIGTLKNPKQLAIFLCGEIQQDEIKIDNKITADRTIIDRIYNKTIETSESGCWLWKGYKRNSKHGSLSVHDTQVYVHRISYALCFGLIPPKTVVCHKCDVPNCINPAHLFAGSQSDNVYDMDKKGRANRVGWPRGEKNVNAHLKDETVCKIREIYKNGSPNQRDVAALFGVSQSTVWRLINSLTRREA